MIGLWIEVAGRGNAAQPHDSKKPTCISASGHQTVTLTVAGFSAADHG